MNINKKISLTKRYQVEFAKDGARYKKGDTVRVNICLASDFFRRGLIAKVPADLMKDAEAAGIESLFQKKGR